MFVLTIVCFSPDFPLRHEKFVLRASRCSSIQMLRMMPPAPSELPHPFAQDMEGH
ncbi:hypothetical protein SCLCIDRAFT_1214341 [Scleroderma citrinum Foug A]|uniref:Uncharacterized protein n=1 Tax=Scleroderma citrinum Foug A TaxID=1036808 RepID=A0A0C3DRE5_9AGAM|nr:hypothetical protein SCLCIDRAFT_1214341 [Scleroderma citrinum Foug A]